MSALAYASSEVNFTDRVAQLLDRVDYRLAVTEEEREAIFRLRYDAYLREGAIPPDPSGRFTDSYDETENVWIFGIYIDDQLASSVRIHVASQHCAVFPSLKVFSDILEPELKAGKVIIDPTRFATDRTLSREYSALPYVTVRLCWLAAEHFEAEHFLAAVRPDHQRFYRRIFDHHVICEARDYPLLSKPISLMTVDYREAANYVLGRYPFFRSSYFERRMLFEGMRYMPAPAARPRPNLRIISNRPVDIQPSQV